MADTKSVTVPVADLERVRDLLMERIYGTPARSPAHNARLEVEAMLSAAPAPEGGAVKDWDAIRSHPCYDEHQPGCDCAALATREEAPAEAGELDVLVTMRDHYTFALKGPWPGILTPNYALAGLFKMAGDEIEALRAQPQAREVPVINIKCEVDVGTAIGTTRLNVVRVEQEDDGSLTAVTDHWPPARKDEQPVADAVEPIERAVAALKGHIEAIQVAKADGGSSSVITDCVNGLPEIVRWIESGVFNVEAAFEQHEDTHPAPDALRGAVEAMEWAIAEIKGDTRYASEDQRQAALEKAQSTLTALASGSGDHSGDATNMIGSGDHAELEKDAKLLIDNYAEGDDRNDLGRRIIALLAENAALRARLDQTYAYAEDNGLLHHRATEAERKLAEAVGLLRDAIAEHSHMTDVEAFGELGNVAATELIAIRTFLSKEAERG